MDITLEVLIGLLRLKRLHAQVMRHDSDESSVPANLDPFGIKPSGFNGVSLLYLMCLDKPNKFIYYLFKFSKNNVTD